MLPACGTSSGSLSKDPKPSLEQDGISGGVFTWMLVRKDRVEWPQSHQTSRSVHLQRLATQQTHLRGFYGS